MIKVHSISWQQETPIAANENARQTVNSAFGCIVINRSEIEHNNNKRIEIEMKEKKIDENASIFIETETNVLTITYIIYTI